MQDAWRETREGMRFMCRAGSRGLENPFCTCAVCKLMCIGVGVRRFWRII